VLLILGEHQQCQLEIFALNGTVETNNDPSGAKMLSNSGTGLVSHRIESSFNFRSTATQVFASKYGYAGATVGGGAGNQDVVDVLKENLVPPHCLCDFS
jgi:hypothetical protein